MIDELRARHAIEAVLARYCYAVDGFDLAAVVCLFTEDCEFDWGWQRVARGRGGITEMLGALWRWSATSHHLGVVSIRFSANDRADAHSPICAWHEVAGSGKTEQLFGVYHDELVKREEGWLIARRRLRAAGWPGFGALASTSTPFEPLTRNGLS